MAFGQMEDQEIAGKTASKSRRMSLFGAKQDKEITQPTPQPGARQKEFPKAPGGEGRLGNFFVLFCAKKRHPSAFGSRLPSNYL